MTFEEAKGYAEQDALTLGQEARLKKLLEEFRAKYKVKVDESLLEKLPDPAPAPAPAGPRS
jgi:hypothetical protein